MAENNGLGEPAACPPYDQNRFRLLTSWAQVSGRNTHLSPDPFGTVLRWLGLCRLLPRGPTSFHHFTHAFAGRSTHAARSSFRRSAGRLLGSRAFSALSLGPARLRRFADSTAGFGTH